MYSIGKFSELCQVPLKTIRYYSDIGLLSPSYIDPATGYRYYDYDKIQMMQKITVLKSCQFSLAQIKEFLESPDQPQWTSVLEQKIGELKTQKDQISRMIGEMNRLKDQIENQASLIPRPQISGCCILDRQELPVYSIRQRIKVAFIDELVKTLFERIYAYNLVVTGKLMAIFRERDAKSGEADVELLLPVKPGHTAEGCKTLTGGTYACLTVKGPYSELNAGYEALSHWLSEQHLTRIGEVIEIYVKGLVPSRVNGRVIRPDLSRPPSEFVTEICVQVVKEAR